MNGGKSDIQLSEVFQVEGMINLMKSYQAIKYYEKGKYEHTKTNIVTGVTAHDYKGAKMAIRKQNPCLFKPDSSPKTGS